MREQVCLRMLADTELRRGRARGLRCMDGAEGHTRGWCCRAVRGANRIDAMQSMLNERHTRCEECKACLPEAFVRREEFKLDILLMSDNERAKTRHCST